MNNYSVFIFAIKKINQDRFDETDINIPHPYVLIIIMVWNDSLISSHLPANSFHSSKSQLGKHSQHYY